MATDLLGAVTPSPLGAGAGTAATASTPWPPLYRLAARGLRRAARWGLITVTIYALLWVAINGGLIQAGRLAAGRTTAPPVPAALRTLGHLQAVDDHLWRSAAPRTAAQYEGLARLGITTVIDLRQLSARAARSEALQLQRFGLRSVVIPIRDGGIPTPTQVRTFLSDVADNRGAVLVHCAAGVGRTGTMVAAYLQATGRATGPEAMVRDLAVGPPSLVQLAFEYDLGRGATYQPPHLAIRWASWLFDEPRMLLNTIKG